MSLDQYLIGGIYAAAILVSLFRDNGGLIAGAVMLANFAGMVFANGDMDLIIVVDCITLAVLISLGSPMSSGLAYCVIVALLIEASSERLGLPFNTTSAIVDAIIVPIALIIGWSNGGGGRLDFNVGSGHRRAFGRRDRRAVSLVARYHAAFDLAGYDAQEKGLRNGP